MKNFPSLHSLHLVAASFLSASCLVLGHSNPAIAAVFYEADKGEAGGTPINAMKVNTQAAGTTLDQINGTLGNDVDLYEIYLTGENFVARVGGNTQYPDTQLFLFKKTVDSAGRARAIGFYANDNDPTVSASSSGALRSRLAVTQGTTGFTAGIYYLAISGYNLDPVTGTGQYIFPDTRRAVVGAQTSSPLVSWDRNDAYTPVSVAKSYSILFQGAQFLTVNSSSPLGLLAPLAPPTPSPTNSPQPSPSPSAPQPSPSPSTPQPSPSPNTPQPSPSPSSTPEPSPSPSTTPEPSPSPSSTPEPSPSPSSTPEPSPS
ncbi:MAG TPA: hypothetical protein V6C88_05720, partial [Chroococcidiopsis sp.]